MCEREQKGVNFGRRSKENDGEKNMSKGEWEDKWFSRSLWAIGVTCVPASWWLLALTAGRGLRWIIDDGTQAAAVAVAVAVEVAAARGVESVAQSPPASTAGVAKAVASLGSSFRTLEARMDSPKAKYNGARPKVRIFQPSGQQMSLDSANEVPPSESVIKYVDSLVAQQIDQAIALASTGQIEKST